MLEVKNLTKIYKPKKGVPVTALDGVSLKFPEKGMVFLLGKSGSGKSTLLNLLGGLDVYDGGEIIIKGVSSKDFEQSRFDSYRNTYVGFIFQEYNILPEFNVGANIALALELQGKKATDDEINSILAEVDLVGYGNRKPNELSGGQLQRVAIARALVKNPEIIMADEPTGALDSNTGKQVFDTLKKLSQDKLVIIVSHDREYAEHYADRIITLADGKIIDDVEYDTSADSNVLALTYEGDTVTVPKGYHLTEEDREAINDYLDSLADKAMIRFSGRSKKFKKTDDSDIPAQDPSKFKLIKSKLPMKSAFKIGAGALKHKKFRLAMTIILSVVAFTLFAFVDTFSAYDHIKTCTNSLMDSEITYASMVKSKLVGEGIDAYWREWGYRLTDADIKSITDETGLKVQGVYVPDAGRIDFSTHSNNERELYTKGEYNIYSFGMSGFVEMSEEDVISLGYEIVEGRMPEKAGEIAIPYYVYETFRIGGYTAGVEYDENGNETTKFEKINSTADMIGKTLKLNIMNSFDIENVPTYTVVGIIDTAFDLSRYEILTQEADGEQSAADDLVNYFLWNELNYAKNYSFHNLAFVSDGAVDDMIESGFKTVSLDMMWMSFHSAGDENTNVWANIDPMRIGKFEHINLDRVVWLDGKEHTSLGEKELVITLDCVYSYNSNGDMIISEPDGDAGDRADYSMYAEFEFNGNMNPVDGDYIYEEGYKVVGIIDNVNNDYTGESDLSVYVSDDLFATMTSGVEGVYSFAVGVMPESEKDVRALVEYCYREDSDIRYPLQNSVTYELDSVNEIFEELSKVFLWIGVGFAIFAAVMLANFIGTSIAYKKQEIGILRAIGSRSNDVFRIFFSESFIIAMINFVIAAIATGVITAMINGIIRDEVGLLITILTFGIRQIALLFAVSVGVAAVASFLPVKKIASKRPIDAIRNK